jgi:lysophospholipase L1-like esterase
MITRLVVVAVLVFASLAHAVPVRVAVIGDSIAFSAKERVNVGVCLRIERRLNERTPGRYSVGSFAVSSTTAAQHLTAWTNQIRNRGFQGIVLASTPVNSFIADVTGAAAFSDINTIITQALADGLWVVAMTTLPWGAYSLWSTPRQTQTDAYLTSIRGRAAITLVELYPTFEQSAGSKTLKVSFADPDLLHLNTAGNDALADALFAAIP